MKTLAFAGSNSSKSINHELVKFASSLLPDAQLIKLTEFNIPMYSYDTEEHSGIPHDIIKLAELLSNFDQLIISVAEHNGNVIAFFKNTLDWLSRHDNKFLANKKVILISTSPGAAAAQSARKITEKMLPYFGAEVVASLGVPSYYQNYNEGSFTKEIRHNLEQIVK